MFLWESSEIFKAGVFPSFLSLKILNSNLVTLIKWLRYRSFLIVFPAISEHYQETFYLESVLLKPEILDCRPVTLREGETVLQRFF